MSGKNVVESFKNLGSKIGTDAKTNLSQLRQKISQNKYIILLIVILIISGISYGVAHNFIGNEWSFSICVILILAFAAMLRFVINIPTIYVIIFILVSVLGLLFLFLKDFAYAIARDGLDLASDVARDASDVASDVASNVAGPLTTIVQNPLLKFAGIIMAIIIGLVLLHLLYIVVIKGVNVTESVDNFFSSMSVSSVTDVWNSITKITNFLCSYFVKGFLVQLVSNSMFIIFLVYLALVVYIYTKQPYQIVSDNKSIFLCIFLFIGFALLSLLIMGFEAFVPFITSFLKYAVLIGIVLGIILAILHVYNNVPMIANTVLFAINIAILVGIFAMIVKFIGAEAPGYITGPPSWSGLLFETLIYIPCLFLDAVDFLKTEFKLAQTQWTYFIILIIEIILIALLFILPKAFDAVINHNGEIILDSVLPLNKKKTIDEVTTTDSNNNQTKSLTLSLADNVKQNKPTYNYGLSAWFYIHPQPKNTNSSYTTSGGVSILDFSGAPTINYDATDNVLKIIVTNRSLEFSYTWIDGSVNPVIIPLSRINQPLPELNSFLQSVMVSKKHYYTNSTTSKRIFLLEILIENATYYIIKSYATNYIIATNSNWTLPSFDASDATWETPTNSIMPVFNVPATNFRDLIGFYAGSYPNAPITETPPNQIQTPLQESPYSAVSKFTPQDPEILSSQIPLQRWNHLFINFNNDGTMDVFLNNKLETSVPNVIPPLVTSLTVGKNKGIYGQACNVVYYRSVLGSDAISWIYNTHKHLNPPTSPNF